MLHRIPGKKTNDDDRGVLGLLLDCHGRIHAFSQLAERLATAHDAPAQEVVAAAADLRRYFSEALPKHEEDEECSIAPRLLAADFGADVVAALATMSVEHHRAHALLATLEPAWDALMEAPHELPARAEELARASSALRAMFVEHLALEENVIFPCIEGLSVQEREAILEEMRARRNSTMR